MLTMCREYTGLSVHYLFSQFNNRANHSILLIKREKVNVSYSLQKIASALMLFASLHHCSNDDTKILKQWTAI